MKQKNNRKSVRMTQGGSSDPDGYQEGGTVGSPGQYDNSGQSSRAMLSSSSSFMVDEETVSTSEEAFFMLVSITFSISPAAMIDAALEEDTDCPPTLSSAQNDVSSSSKVRPCTRDSGRSFPEMFRASATSMERRR